MTAAQLAAKHRKRAALVPREFLKTTSGLSESARRYAWDLLTEQIYAIPEDVSPRTGKRKWKRTGDLRLNEKVEVRSNYSFALVNSMPYAVPRHEAGKPGKRNINVRRVSHWRDDLLEKFRPFVLEYQRLTIRKILEAK